MFEPRPPIFVHDRGDLTAHRSTQDALNHIEPWDVSDSLEAFDADGRRLSIKAEGVRRTRFTVGGGTTALDGDASGERAPELLEAILRHYVADVGPARVGFDDQRLATAQLSDLVETLGHYFGVS